MRVEEQARPPDPHAAAFGSAAPHDGPAAPAQPSAARTGEQRARREGGYEPPREDEERHLERNSHEDGQAAEGRGGAERLREVEEDEALRAGRGGEGGKGGKAGAAGW